MLVICGLLTASETHPLYFCQKTAKLLLIPILTESSRERNKKIPGYKICHSCEDSAQLREKKNKIFFDLGKKHNF